MLTYTFQDICCISGQIPITLHHQYDNQNFFPSTVKCPRREYSRLRTTAFRKKIPEQPSQSLERIGPLVLSLKNLVKTGHIFLPVPGLPPILEDFGKITGFVQSSTAELPYSGNHNQAVTDPFFSTNIVELKTGELHPL